MPGPWVITATGLISAAGDDPEALFSRLLEARPLATGQPELAPPAQPPLPAVRIRDFDPSRYLARKGIRHLSRTSQLVCAAASRLRDELRDLQETEVGVVLGTAWASMDTVVRFEREAYTEGPRFVDPVLFTETVANVPAGQVSIIFGWSALNVTVASGPASGAEALLRAVDFLEEGRARLVVAGGGDELNVHLLRTLQADGLASGSTGSLPFAADSSGPICGEGACMFAIESEASAAARGVRAVGRLRGGASRSEDGAERDLPQRADWIRHLLDRIGVGIGDIDLLVLSANANAEGDHGEAAALVDLFGPTMPPAVAPKAVLGETWGAAGTLGVATALQSMARRLVPPAPESTAAGARALGLNLPRAAEPRDVACVLVLDGAGSSRFSAIVLTE